MIKQRQKRKQKRQAETEKIRLRMEECNYTALYHKQLEDADRNQTIASKQKHRCLSRMILSTKNTNKREIQKWVASRMSTPAISYVKDETNQDTIHSMAP
jgi:hypothetical protein